ncbi:hypothetical protein CGLAMM_04730 [Acetobacteraceae bacterium EV16G]|uniref:Lipoprotein n=1 Tax=Sorlinia euscelidii TaxID=3081148 RepID=A0ABU7TZC4_9PROT
MKRVRIGVTFMASIMIFFTITGCGQRRPDPSPPIDYADFNTLNLNVASITVVDDSARQHVPGDISYRASIPLMMRIREMVAHRLNAAGSHGTAKITVVRDSIQHAPVSTLIGQLSLRIDVASPSSDTAGYAVIRTESTAYTGDIDAESPEALDNMGISMMRSMNSALEYQIRHVLGDWLVDASGMPLRHDVKQVSLNPGSGDDGASTAGDAAADATPGVTIVKAPEKSAAAQTPKGPKSVDVPDAVFPLGDDSSSPAAAGTQLSPQPGTLHLPNHRGI